MKKLLFYLSILCSSNLALPAAQGQQLPEPAVAATAVGAHALNTLKRGAFVTGIGVGAGTGLVAGVNDIYIGARAGNAEENGVIYIGDKDSHKLVRIQGIHNSPSEGEGARVVLVDETGRLVSISFETLLKMLHGLQGKKEGQKEVG